MFRPASIIVANWREKTCIERGLIFLNVVRRPCLAARRQLAQLLGEQAADAELLACGVDVGRVDLADGLEALDVDRGVGEAGHYAARLLTRRRPRVRSCVHSSKVEPARTSTLSPSCGSRTTTVTTITARPSS